MTTSRIQLPIPTQSRFRVVKLESKEPFRRGRWQCIDFLEDETIDVPKIASAVAGEGEAEVPDVGEPMQEDEKAGDEAMDENQSGNENPKDENKENALNEDNSPPRDPTSRLQDTAVNPTKTLESIQAHHIDGIQDEGAITAEEEHSSFGVELKVEQALDLVKLHIMSTTHSELLPIRQRMIELEKRCAQQQEMIQMLKENNNGLWAQNEYYRRAFSAAVVAVQASKLLPDDAMTHEFAGIKSLEELDAGVDKIPYPDLQEPYTEAQEIRTQFEQQKRMEEAQTSTASVETPTEDSTSKSIENIPLTDDSPTTETAADEAMNVEVENSQSDV